MVHHVYITNTTTASRPTSSGELVNPALYYRPVFVLTEIYLSTYKGTEFPDEYVVMGAHYDSRGTFGHVRAPGESMNTKASYSYSS